jgi:two-component system NtrC family sensor kinase
MAAAETIAAETSTLYWVVASIFFLLTLLHYTFSLYNPTQHANRYFACYALVLGLGFGCVNYSGSSLALLPSSLICALQTQLAN